MGRVLLELSIAAALVTGCAADNVPEVADDAGVEITDRFDAASPRDVWLSAPEPDVFDVRDARDAIDALATDAPAIDAPPAVDATTPDAPAPIDATTMICSLPAPAARPPAAGPDGAQVPRDVGAEHPDWVVNSCVTMGGDSRFLFEVVRRLRTRDPRWGLDRSLGPLTGDVVTYFHGDGCPEGRAEVYKFDIIARHCGILGVHEPPAPTWIDRSSEGGVWTLRGYDGTVSDAGVSPDAVTAVDVAVARPPLPDGSGVVRAVAAERPELLRGSCVTMGGNNDFLFEVVRRLRRLDARWGLNWKRGNIGDLSQDVVDYYFGAAGAPMESSTEVYIVDIIGGHCGGAPSASWTDVTEATRAGGTIGRWTLAGRTDLGP